MSAPLPALGYLATARIWFSSSDHATMAARTLAVDGELQPTKAAKSFTVEGNYLVGCVRLRRAMLGALGAHACEWAHCILRPSILRLHPPPPRSTFHASEARVLRVMISSFYDMLGVTVRTLRDFT